MKLHIAVGVVSDAQGRILISERKPDCAFAGQWEFPGGKCERGETVEQALGRELKEELGITVSSLRPLIRFEYHYPDRHVLLDTWRVTEWQGTADPLEGQRLAWVAPRELDAYPMLAANRPIVRAAQLPELYLFTPEPGPDRAVFLAALDPALGAGIRLLRLRAPSLADEAYRRLAIESASICRDRAGLMLDRDPVLVREVGARGLHLSAAAAAQYTARPLGSEQWLAVSCHNAPELAHAQKLGADFAVLGPVRATDTHPLARTLGWPGFSEMAAGLPLPVYGIGGLGRNDLPEAWRSGAQGIAAIRALWGGA